MELRVLALFMFMEFFWHCIQDGRDSVNDVAICCASSVNRSRSMQARQCVDASSFFEVVAKFADTNSWARFQPCANNFPRINI